MWLKFSKVKNKIVKKVRNRLHANFNVPVFIKNLLYYTSSYYIFGPFTLLITRCYYEYKNRVTKAEKVIRNLVSKATMRKRKSRKWFICKENMKTFIFHTANWLLGLRIYSDFWYKDY
jgi:hypothetical protein